MARDSRTETIQALDTFIATQHLLLERQKDDIDRLQKLRRDLNESPSGVLSNLSDELNDGTFRLSAQTDLRLVLPQRIDWSVFDKADTTPFDTLVSRLSQKRVDLSKTQQSPLSELQVLVKTAKHEILVPILETIAKSTLALQVDSEEEEELDPLERKRCEERTKILELKKRKVRGGGSRLSLPTRNVVFVRDDLEDETGEVDIDSWGDGGRKRDREGPKIRTESPNSTVVERANTEKPSLKVNGRPHKTMCKDPSCHEEVEERPRKKAKPLPSPTSRPHTKVSHRSSVIHFAKSPTPSDDDDPGVLNPHSDTPLPQDDITEKPKSKTYKQAWSVDEQNLLEQLLEAIPDGEQYRWLKISKAMGGLRTPRQVASRVQKYFEKLRKFGVSVD